MIGHALLPIVSAVTVGAGGLLAVRAFRIWRDASIRGFSAGNKVRKTLVGSILPAHYWWGARIEAMSRQEQRELLARETTKLELSEADNERCPLCGAEIAHAWALTSDGRPGVASGPIECPACDFRLDACRHCDHFLPGSPRGWLGLEFGESDITFGRCGFYKKVQPVEEAASPDVARQLKSRGYDRISAPMPIQDSMLRPDSCRAFRPRRQRIKDSGLAWPDDRRIALLHLQDPESRSKAAAHKGPSLNGGG